MPRWQVQLAIKLSVPPLTAGPSGGRRLHYQLSLRWTTRRATHLGQVLTGRVSDCLMTIQVHPKSVSEDASFSYVRHNGWSRPIHFFQIIGWTLYFLFGLVNFLLLVPNFANPAVVLSLISFNLAIYSMHFVFNVIAASVNPIDDNVLSNHKTALKPRKFDRSTHKHVIENQFCYICESQVGSKSKHCSLCNKCVSNFDQ